MMLPFTIIWIIFKTFCNVHSMMCTCGDGFTKENMDYRWKRKEWQFDEVISWYTPITATNTSHTNNINKHYQTHKTFSRQQLQQQNLISLSTFTASTTTVAILARGCRGAWPPPPPLLHKQKIFLYYFAFIFFTYSRTYFSLYIAKCQSVVCVILLLNAIAP